MKVEDFEQRKFYRQLKKMERINPELLPQTESEKPWKAPGKLKSLFKKEKKKPDMILVQYLTKKYESRWALHKVIGGDVIVVNNKVHRINPKCMYRQAGTKNAFYIFREIDRRPISNLDYNKVIRRRDDTEADVPLIKAVLGAVKKPSPLADKKNLIKGIAIIGGIAVALFVLLKYVFKIF